MKQRLTQGQRIHELEELLESAEQKSDILTNLLKAIAIQNKMSIYIKHYALLSKTEYLTFNRNSFGYI